MTRVCELPCWKMFMGAVVFHMLANKPLFILVKITKDVTSETNSVVDAH